MKIELGKLTNMERRSLLEFVVDGEADKIIARRIGCSPGSVHTHMAAVLRKLGLRKRTQLIAAYYREGVV